MNMRGLMQRWLQGLALARLAGLLIPGALVASAHETDNFCLPLDTELADLGHFLETVHTMVLQETVADVNACIEKAIRINDHATRAARLRECHDPLTLSKAFMKRFGHPLFEDGQMERALRGAWAHQTYAGQKPSHQDLRINFAAHFPLDPRRLMVLSQSRTVKAFGVYFGGDKLVHFHHLGADYYRMYLSLITAGLSKEAAYRKVIEHYAEGGVWSEKALFGTLATGIYSNADMAANHLGFKFFLNLTERVVLKGEAREPLLMRSGVFWRLNLHVRPGSGWFGAFISDHWNEALNPNRYSASMRPGIRRALRGRAKDIVRFYTQKDGRPEDPAYFDNLARELSTYYGEAYGHSGQVETLMTIGNTCIPAIRGPDALRVN
jgi:hypothetical protein